MNNFEGEKYQYSMESFAPFPSHHDFPFVCDQKIIIKLELNKVMMRKRKQASEQHQRKKKLFPFSSRHYFHT
jgi:hypothetical protein